MSLPVKELNAKDTVELENIILSHLKGSPETAYTFDEIADIVSGKFDVESEVRWSNVISRAKAFEFIRKVYRRLALVDSCLASLVASGTVRAKSIGEPSKEPVYRTVPVYTTYYYIAGEDERPGPN